ncbi:MAG TPA: type II toxin-antitoxin system RelE/ParE family toxin [Patescibacteria group bacterium]|nr:type II toxin-antitoxin system RelE/ParE family toxin [Patescibacteria group bacterium]
MTGRWTIEYYQSPSGNEPVFDFIESLPLKTKTRVYSSFELLCDYGTHVGPPHVKKLSGTPLWELRILGENSVRVIYITITGRVFLLLHACLKKKQKTPEKDIKTALARLHDYVSRH